MKKLWMFLAGGVALLTLIACSTGVKEIVDTTSNDSGNVITAAPRLNADYDDAMSVQEQLALGTVQLEESEMAIDETQASELLPLWQALQSLNNSDTAAEIEIEAVVNQIQDTMTAEQVQAISDMALTTDSLAELIESGELQIGFGRGAGGGEGGEGGLPGGFGGGIPGGFGGGGQGGGFPGGGFAGGGDLSEDDIATRRAARESGNLGGFQERALMGMTIGLLAGKTGEQIANPRGNIFETVFTTVSKATGLSTEEIQTKMADGETLVEVIEGNGGDVSAVREAIIEALNALPNADTLDAEQIADDWLGE